MKTGIELISVERQEQIVKHGYDADFVNENFQYYDAKQLAWMAELLLSASAINVIEYNCYPANWPKDEVEKMLNKPYKERLIISGALIAAEIDRLSYYNELQEGKK